MNAFSLEKVIAESLAEIGVTPERQAPPKGRPRTTEWFPHLYGIGLRSYASGRKIYVAQTRMGGRSRTVTLGSTAVLTEAQAVLVGRRVVAHALVGDNPATVRKRERQAPTYVRFLEEYWSKSSKRWKPSTQVTNGIYRRLYLDRAFEGLTIDALTEADVARWFNEVTDISGPGGANSCLGILNTAFKKAEAWGYRPGGSNPCTGIRWNKRRKCERFLSEPELKRLGEVLATERAGTNEKASLAASAITLILLTGCRRSEIGDLQWPDVRGRKLHLRDSKTGPRVVWIGDETRTLIDQLPRSRSLPWLFAVKGKHVTASMIDNRWRKIRLIADLPGVRLHDLRHTFASHAAMTSETLPMIGKLLGHKSVKATARYTHLDDAHLQQAAEQIGAVIAGFMSGATQRVGTTR